VGKPTDWSDDSNRAKAICVMVVASSPDPPNRLLRVDSVTGLVLLPLADFLPGPLTVFHAKTRIKSGQKELGGGGQRVARILTQNR